MRATPDPEIGADQTSAIPVSPVQIDLAALRGPPASLWDRARFPVIVLACLGLHATLLLTLEQRPETTLIEEAIPVEVIVEPPPEEEAAKPPDSTPEKPEPQAQVIEEKPVTDAARSADQDREDGKAAAPPQARASEPDVAAAAPPDRVDPPPPAPEPGPAPEARPDPPPAPTPPAKPAPAPRFAGLEPLPDFEFQAPLAKRSDRPGGTADPGYLSTLYGMIMRRMPQMPKQPRTARGRVTFGINASGQVFRESIEITSGAPFLDAAALAAVRKAAPFPAPPKGGPVFIRFDYGSD